jgi:hypothetical protein
MIDTFLAQAWLHLLCSTSQLFYCLIMIIIMGSLRVRMYVLLPFYLDQSTVVHNNPLHTESNSVLSFDSYSSISDASPLIFLALELLPPPVLWKNASSIRSLYFRLGLSSVSGHSCFLSSDVKACCPLMSSYFWTRLKNSKIVLKPI